MFTLRSNDFTDGKYMPILHVFNGFGHSGQNISPHLAWSGAPAGTKSFVLTCYDPDAPTGSGWWHWLVSNIPPNVNELPTGASPALLPPAAIESRTDFGPPGYGGPAPPPGPPHRYIFTLFAMKIDKLDVTPDTPAAMIGFQCNFNYLAKTSLTALYGK